MYRTKEEEIASIERRIQGINLEIEQIQSQITGKKESEENDRKLKEGELVDIVNRAEETEAKEGGKDDTVLELTKRIEDLKSTRKKVQSILSLLAAFRQDVQAFQTLFEQRVQPINSDLESLDLDKLDQLPAELPGLRDTMTEIESNEEILVEEQKRLNTELDSAEQEVSVLQGISRVIADLRQKINDIAAEIEAIEQRINEINAKEKQISELDEERFDLFITLLRKTIEMRQFLQNTIDEFEIDKDEMLGRLAFSALIDTGKRTKYVENLAAKVDNRRHSEADLSQKLTPVFTKMDSVICRCRATGRRAFENQRVAERCRTVR